MSEFSICLQALTQQKNRITSVEDAIKACKRMVDGVNSGLGAIGIGGVGNALSAISSRLVMHANKCEMLSTSLIQIIRKYQYAENTIAGTRTIQQIFEELVQAAEQAFQPIEQPEYVGAIYLVHDDGAFLQGHAAVVLLLSDGTYEYYSYGSDMGLGYLWDNITDINNQSQSGTLDIDPTGDDYSNYIFIPISDEQGDAMHDAAQNLLANPGDYELFGNNCNMNAQAILDAGGVSFAPSEFDMIATRPNTVYQNFLDLVNSNPDAYAGYQFGNIPGEDLVGWLNDSEGAQQFVSGNYDYSVAHTDNVSFVDPTGFLAGGLESVFGGTTMGEISQYWNQGLSGDWQSDLNFIYDHVQGIGNYNVDTTQSVVNTGVDWLQTQSTSAIDWVQNNIISQAGIVGDGANVVIDGIQWAGNGIIDGAQWVGNGIVDGVQWVGNGIADGAQWIGNGIIDGAEAIGDGIGAAWNYIFG